MTQDDRKLLEEIADRARRTETRVTKVANHLGIDAGGDKPTWDNARGRVNVPTRKVSLDDMLGAVPLAARQVLTDIKVYCGEDYLLTFTV
jgi:hypothetical protein